MFVSDLDRPWHETPFPIQGFVIRKSDDIKQLLQYCSHVFIDQAEEREIESFEEIDPKDSVESKKETIQLPPIVVEDPTQYPIETSTSKEVSACREILKKSYSHFGSIYQSEELTPEMTESLAESAQEISASVARNPNSMLWLSRMQSHNSHTYQHSLRMTVWALTLGRYMGLPPKMLSKLSTGCMLAQVGKLSLPSDLLSKEGKMEPLDLEVFKGYVDAGVDMLQSEALSEATLSVVRYHQERHNGSGFPNELPGSRIPLLAAIAGLAYYFELLITPAPKSGREPRTPSQALNILYQVRDAKFHGDLVDAFIQAVGVYPVGSQVELSNGYKGVVLSHGPESRLLPKVILLIGPDGKRLAKNITFDLKKHAASGEEPVTIRRCLEDRHIKVTMTAG